MTQTIGGAPEELEAQGAFSAVLQSAASAAGNGTAANTTGINGFLAAQIDNSDAAGTATIALQGSYDGTNWFALGYQQIDNTAAPARSVASIAVAANSHHVYQLLDYYPFVRSVLSSPSGFTSGGVTVTLYGVAV